MTAFTAILVGNDTLTGVCARQMLERGNRIAAVVTRDADLRAWAEGEGLRVEAPGRDLGARLAGVGCDWLLSVANLDILGADVLALAGKGAVNFHDGPLPRYAGLNAPVWALLADEPRHAITWHMIDGGVDEGDILVQQGFDISPDDTALSLNLKCFAAAVESFGAVLDQLASGAPNRTAQDLSKRSYFGRDARPEAMGHLRFDRPASEGARLVRALDHGDYVNRLCTAKLRIENTICSPARAEDVDGSGNPGEVLAVDAEALTVACAEGALRLSGLRRMDGTWAAPEDLVAVGATLPLISDDEAEALSALAGALAPADPYWRRCLKDFAPATLATGPQAGQGVGETLIGWPAALDLPQKAALVAQWAATACGAEVADIALTHRALPENSGDALTWVPLRQADDLAEVEGKPAIAADIALREPGLPPLSQPDIALSLGGRTLAGSKLTVTPHGTLFHDRARISDAMAQILAERLNAMAEAAARGEDAPTMPAAERDLVLHGWNRTEAEYDRAATLPMLLEAQVARTPEATALVVGAEAISYRELNARANRAAHVLRTMGVGPGTLVGLCTGRNAHLVIGALAILKAGGAYVPLDPAYPADRLALYLDDSGAPVVLSERALAGILPESGARVLMLDNEPVIEAAPSDNPAPLAGPGDLAYLIYTSGSTGRPKGVMIEHRNVVNFFAGMDARIAGDTPGTWLALTSLSFDISVLELFYSLARGSKLVLVTEEQKLETTTAPTGDGMEFSLYYWGNDDGVGRDKYRSLLEGAKFADQNGFCAVWTPERHFHAFGGPYPNPSVTGAAVAGVTQNLSVRAGSCVAPLHHTARIAEEWAVIDNLTNGRAGMAIASGWQPDDFVLRPENTPPENKPTMLRQIEELRRLWAGEAVEYARQDGTMHAVVTQPRPVSKKLPIWVTTAGNPATWKEAGKIGANVLTHLLGQSIDEVAGKIKLYHEALREAGHDPAEFKVTLMLHTFVAATRDEAREVAREPMKDYLRAAAGLIKQYAWAFPAFKRPEGATNAFDLSLEGLTDEELDAILDFAFQRYFDDSGLFGTVEDCVTRVASLKEIGVTEVACLIDYGIAVDTVLEGLRPLAEVLRRCNPEVETDHSIAAQITRHGVTHLQCTPSMARLLLLSPDTRAALARVEQIMLGGEPLPGALVDELRALTDARIENMYGPTETTIWSSTGAATGGEAICDIGTPIANTQFYVLDGAMDPVPVGVTGELYIGGAGVARGYWQRDDLTAEAFRPDPFTGGRMYRTGDLARWRGDGRVDFLGRADTQIKLRGYRIELGEIEARLEAMAGVTRAIVVVRDGQSLVAFYDGAAPASQLRRALAADLPDHMVPSRFERLAEFPLTPNRKVDRKALAERALSPGVPVTAPPEAVAVPQSAAQARDLATLQADIAAIWSRILGVAEISPQANFFELGGHSLLAVQAHRDMREALGTPRLSIADVFGYPTLAGLAGRIAAIGGAKPSPRPASEHPATAPQTATPEARDPVPPSDNAHVAARQDAMARRREMRARRRTG